MSTFSIQALVALVSLTGGILIGLTSRAIKYGAREANKDKLVEKNALDINQIGGLARRNDEKEDRDYFRMVAYEVKKAVPGRQGDLLAELIQRGRVD